MVSIAGSLGIDPANVVVVLNEVVAAEQAVDDAEAIQADGQALDDAAATQAELRFPAEMRSKHV